MKRVHLIPLAALLFTGLPAIPSQADESPEALKWQELPKAPNFGSFVGEVGIPIEIMTDNFMAAHPDMRWRRKALHYFSNKKYKLAMAYFLRAAHYGDKPSQAMIAEMYWEGLGVAHDPVQGYIWMDLAAERRYPNFVILRESYWAKLDPEQQRAALEQGLAVYDEYGDEVAEPRLARVLRRERRTATGSRIALSDMNMKIIPLTGPMASSADFSPNSYAWVNGGLLNGGSMSIRGDVFNADKYWDPVKYRALQDSIWSAPRKAEVTVGELQPGSDETRD